MKKLEYSPEARIEGDTVKVVNILNEKQDFMRNLFGIKTTSDDTEEYLK